MNDTSASSQTFDVVIVGRGPVGSTLANLLGLCGLRTLVLEREAKAYHLPRAVHFDDECMRVFQTIGLGEAILPHVILSPGMRFVDAEGRLVLDWPRSRELTPMGWHLSYRFHQPDLEDVLNKGLERWSHIEVRNRCDVFAIDQDHTGARVRYEDLCTGQLVEVRCAYVVGCDGARSLVRRFIGAGMDDLGFHERWLVVDVLLRGERPDLGDYSVQFCNPQRPATYIRGTGRRRRWEITVRPDEDALLAAQPGRVWELLSPWLKANEAEIERAAVYTFHSAIAQQWRSGRLLLAGDSAHQTPPFLGQGMCAGIRDAANLAWKLDYVLQGKAAPDLLDTYQSERAPHVREFIELAIRLGGLINTKAVEAALATGIPHDDGPLKLEVRKPRLGPGLAFSNTALSGTLAPQFGLPNNGRSDDRVGYRFALLCKSGCGAALLQQHHPELAGIEVLRGEEATGLEAWLEEQGLTAALVRPDRHILGTAQTETDVPALLSSLPFSTAIPSAA
ncbi:bifunctional 3-(3-hydroxy-phenyl)propionate/3-hydroxycinnamic acid hydroxylase [Bradyrhizobium sp.]|uniref:bifunctional 3-(3-hydroxy-phenyl)propionate/3-hydroxycinnamic acid hydroxylase MhpA n=1 Tax=Bradyrhizobium sp. TaxID=376 RepID=UPI002D70E958|nr:bifunctional 3-(3-hydroxy-phenyl)propionate/3-hydroxycinnamic acid hydroxylase [Bradyrhizobium sp.]HZR72302.1 bifunctional 3-(3-hydroxy-phenyl)propionate/3-hydroxycinnamic acid hydroxylase [Bradyrhizobium sp.]